MRSSFRRLSAACGVLLVVPSAHAQFCFRDGPPSGCATVAVVEFGGLRAFENELRAHNVNTGFWEVGLLRNRPDGRTAFGGSVYLSYDDESYRNLVWAVKARARRRLTGFVAIDAGAGVIFAARDTDPWVDLRLPGATVRATLNVADWVGVTTGFDAYRLRIDADLPPAARDRLRDEQWSWYVGVQGNGYLGVAGGIVGAAVVIIANAVRD